MVGPLESWCHSNTVNVNLEKSKIVHIRTQSVTRSNFQFIFNGKEVDIVSKYAYLGLLLTAFLSYEGMVKAVAKSVSRALGLLIAKYIKHMVISI